MPSIIAVWDFAGHAARGAPRHRPRVWSNSPTVVHSAKICIALVVAFPIWLALIALFWVLPVGFASGSCLVGVVLFMCGKELNRKWMASVGGILAFAALFAWALKQ